MSFSKQNQPVCYSSWGCQKDKKNPWVESKSLLGFRPSKLRKSRFCFTLIRRDWSLNSGDFSFLDLACQFQNCKLEVCMTNGYKVKVGVLAPPCSKPFRRACTLLFFYDFSNQNY